MIKVTRTTWVTAGVLVVSLGLAAALKNGVSADVAGEGVSALAPVQVLVLNRESITGEVTVGGFLRAREDVTIFAERAGRVVALPVPEGQPVGVGDTVAELDDTAARADLAQARAAAREAGLDPNLSAADLERSRSALLRAEHEYALHHPAAPIGGRVEKHHVDVGEYVAPGTPLVDVLDVSALILDVDVDAEIVALLDETGATVMALGERVAAKITRIAGRADRSTRRFRVELSIEPGRLRPGMHAEARFRLPAQSPAFYVPKAAVRRHQGEVGVFVVRDGAADWIPLKLESVHQRPEVWRVGSEGLEEGAALVVSGFSGLRAGMAVQVAR